MTVGFDFGTTNSLIAVVLNNRAIPIYSRDDRQPFSSAVRFEGTRTIVGREARIALGEAGLGIHGDTVRSPKFELGKDRIVVGGVERDPVDIVAKVATHVKEESLKHPEWEKHLRENYGQAVVTIPVTMDGPKRSALRAAFNKAETEIFQFVHEPFAALYGYIRSQPDQDAARRELDQRDVLVVDWGGGTLDLTLCRVTFDRIIQKSNKGDGEIGGDKFDETLRNEIIKRFCQRENIPESVQISGDAKLRLLDRSERHKIELSIEDEVDYYIPNFFQDPDKDLEYLLTRDELNEITQPLIDRGMDQIKSLLADANIGPGQVDLCLVAGGMASMPAIGARLNELFGTNRVEIPQNSRTLVAEGAAWIAHDSQRLRLARQLEVQLARGSHLPIVRQNVEVPGPGGVLAVNKDLYCTDPTDGSAVFNICSPDLITDNPQAFHDRTTLDHLSIEVSSEAEPFLERLHLEFLLDPDLIMHVKASSSLEGSEASIKLYALEFSINLPDTGNEGEIAGETQDV